MKHPPCLFSGDLPKPQHGAARVGSLLALCGMFLLGSFAHAATSRPTKKQASKVANQAKPATKKLSAKKAAKKATQKKAAKPSKPRPLHAWLLLGPAPLPLPMFANEKGGQYKEMQLLSEEHLDQARLHPKTGKSIAWLGGKSLRWKAWVGGRIARKGKAAQVAWAATWLRATRYTEVTLSLRSHQRLRVFLDGHPVGLKAACTPHKQAPAPMAQGKGKQPAPTSMPAQSKDPRDQLLFRMAQVLERQSLLIERQSKLLGQMLQRAQRKAPKAGTLRVSLKLTPGLHRIVVKTLATKGCTRAWGLRGKLEAPKRATLAAVHPQRAPTYQHSMDFLLYRKYLGGSSLSPDGKLVVLSMSKLHPNGHSEHWSELRSTKDGKLLHSLRAVGALRDLRWSPNGRYYSFITYIKGKGAIWRVHRKSGKVRLLREGLQGLWGHAWSHNSRTIIYNAVQRPNPTSTEKAGLQRLRGMFDRWPTHRFKTHLYALSADGKMHIQLTAGYWGSSRPELHPTEPKLLFQRTLPDDKTRPFRRTDIYELDLRTLQSTRVLSGLRSFNSVSYALNGKALLLRGGPSLFGITGYDPKLPPRTVPNDYEGELYLYDRQSKQTTCLTKTFDPSVSSAFWHPRTGKIYVNALHRTQYFLYELDPQSGVIQKLPTAPGLDIIGGARGGRHTDLITYAGSGMRNTRSLYTFNLVTKQGSLLYDPNLKPMQKLQLGAISDWSATMKDGEQLDGRIYYPPGFDARRRYPLIVYYYGGTFPVTRGFDGRYPFHLWAAHGYVVYVLQPSGAVGFGQRFAARHVNEWGTRVPHEIIHATKQFLHAHPFVHPKRVGCIGASYGGFTTMSLVTKTKLFAAAISHAGISNIPSYWGGGYWGYLYSAISAANRYPWSHPQYFLRQSPLFSANKIKTPLLLLHGSKDTNVPAIESYQMYAALRLLKRPVEMVVVKGEDHWILQPKKRILWSQTILAWFDRHLKKQSLWWERLHGKRPY
ncbi:MAG: S9 family peptidase [Myxococcales bacterium]|nr:S9 family peptidase [Myxococcales bacterium]